VRRAYIEKPGGGERPLGIPCVRDRVVQAALRHVLEPIFERDFASHSYGFRPGVGCKDALRRVDELLRAGYTHVVDADLQSYFDTIPHDKLLGLVRGRVADGRVLTLVGAFLTQGVMDGLDRWRPTSGSPQGAVISPLLSNVYLDPLDHLMARSGIEMTRYADDFVILCRGEREALDALELVRRWAAGAGLTLHPAKTRVVDLGREAESFDFLGYHFERARAADGGGITRRPRDKSLAKLKDTIRAKTRRTSGHCLGRVIDEVNLTLKGWFVYFKHCHPRTFPRLDAFVRKRLRSILRRRSGRRGPSRGEDHRLWPNAFFTGQGLFSLVAAHCLARQSARAVNH
jgi:RNA-directed DNA polymerase